MKIANHNSSFRASAVAYFQMAEELVRLNNEKWIEKNFGRPSHEISRADIWELSLRVTRFLTRDDRGLVYRPQFYRSGISPKMARRLGWVELRTVCSHYASGWDCECGSGREYLSPSEADRLVACGRLRIYTDSVGGRHGERLNGLGQAVMAW